MNINYENYYWQNNLIRLRAMEPSDWEMSYLNKFDSEARRLLQSEIELPPTENEAKESTEKYTYFSDKTHRLMFVIETLDNEVVGGVNLNSIDERNGTFSIGMYIYSGMRGKGYGTSAMRILLDYAFNERRLNKFNAAYLYGNKASEALLIKLGCKKEGVRRETVFTDGEFKDEILYGLTKEDYINRNI